MTMNKIYDHRIRQDRWRCFRQELSMCFDRVIAMRIGHSFKYVPINWLFCEGNPMTIREAISHLISTYRWGKTEAFRECSLRLYDLEDRRGQVVIEAVAKK